MFYLSNKTATLFLPFFLIGQLGILAIMFSLLRKRWLIFSVGVFFVITALFHWTHFILFDYELTEGAVAAILATNIAESFEFLKFLPWTAWASLFFFIASMALFIKITPVEVRTTRREVVVFVCMCVMPFALKLVVSKSLATSIDDVLLKSQPLKTVLIFSKGFKLVQDVKDKLASVKLLDLHAINKIAPVPQVHILVIGESARKKNWQFYGYPRETNRHTSKFKNELLIFRDVVSSANSTILSLLHLLTYSQTDQMTSIFDQLKKVGVKTYWLSNQAKFGAFDGPTTVIASRADKLAFINSDTANTSYDERLLPILEEALNDTAEKKFIILHLMGSHYYYNRRYPPQFNIFQDNNILNQVGYKTNRINIINEYDNSILYTDYVLGLILDKVKQRNMAATVLYASDHGETLFDEKDFYGHGGVVFHPSEVEIPMMLWLSPQFKEAKPEVSANAQHSVEKKISLMDFFPSYLYLLGLELELEGKRNFFLHENPTQERSIFNMSLQKTIYKDL